MRLIIFIFICIIRIQFIWSDDNNFTSIEAPNNNTQTITSAPAAAPENGTANKSTDQPKENSDLTVLEIALPDFLEIRRDNLSAKYKKRFNFSTTAYTIRENFPEDVRRTGREKVVFSCPLDPLDLPVPGVQNSTDNNTTQNETSASLQTSWEIIDLDGDTEIITKLHIENIAADKSYVIDNPTTDDNGEYMCIIHDEKLIYDARTANLTILQPPNDDNSKSDLLILILISVSLIVVGFLLLGAYLERKNRGPLSSTIKRVIIERDGDSEDILKSPIVRIECRELRGKHGYAENLEYELPYDSKWEFPRENLKLCDTLLGQGEFGQVVQAEAYGILEPEVWSTVAVKTLKENHIDEDMASIVAEVEIMKMIGAHKHVLKLLGCCSQAGPFYMIMEHALYGNLKSFLRQFHSSSDNPTATDHEFVLNNKVLIHFAHQIAEGMNYLASLKCVHRDLAARNVLVCEEYVMKVADFGLARDIHYNEYYRNSTKGRLPVKWMAPEALLQRMYTSKSDSWSYGILLWEMMTLGGVPYPSVPCVEQLFQVLRRGYRMESPPNCPPKLYNLMRDCWKDDPNQRPDFQKIMESLDEILAENDGLDIVPSSGLSVHSSVDNFTTSSDEEDDLENGGDTKRAQYPLLKERAAQLANYAFREEHVSEKSDSLTRNSAKMRHSFAISEANEYISS